MNRIDHFITEIDRAITRQFSGEPIRNDYAESVEAPLYAKIEAARSPAWHDPRQVPADPLERILERVAMAMEGQERLRVCARVRQGG